MAKPGSKQLDFYLVLDFEATCSNTKPLDIQEIIEFPVLLINSRTLQTEAEFHTYVRPTANPLLTQFCTELTGITQDNVDGQPILAEVLERFHEWYTSHDLHNPDISSCFVTCGDWDLKTMLPNQCRNFGLKKRAYFQRWINIKRVFQAATGVRAKGMPFMLNHFGLELEGRHHSGIDDSRNIAKILIELIKLQPNIQQTSS